MNDDGKITDIITGSLVPSFHFPGVTFHFKPPRIEVDQGVDWDEASKRFWNLMARQIGQELPFPDEG